MIELNTIHNEDCLDTMKRIPDNSISLIIADPPYYKITKEEWDNNFDNKEDYISWCIQWTKESFRILKEGGQFYVWGGVGKHDEHPFIEYMLEIEKQTKFKFINWITMRNFRVFGNARHFPFARQELLVYSKGKHGIHNKQYSDFEGLNRLGNPKLVSNVWVDCKDVSLYNRKNTHPTEKSYLSSERIVLASTNKEDVVYIPFTGSGVDIQACINNSRKYIASEINSEYIENIIKPRIDNLLTTT